MGYYESARSRKLKEEKKSVASFLTWNQFNFIAGSNVLLHLTENCISPQLRNLLQFLKKNGEKKVAHARIYCFIAHAV